MATARWFRDARYGERVQRDDPERKKKAVVATAHYLVRAMWGMMKRGTLWKETVAEQEETSSDQAA
ncbi:MAG: hypothetical protein CMJ48_02480 [Planctomycetaceae bacterium]|nr:hypothetical protein [Planctomycetaceae bacterium]